jgi:hypothetical protein
MPRGFVPGVQQNRLFNIWVLCKETSLLPEKGSGSPMVFSPRSVSERKGKITNKIPVCNMFKS